MTEQELLAAVAKLCDEYKLFWYHSTDSRKDYGCMGFPDLIITGTSVIFAELKTNWGQMSGTQTNWRYRLIAAGANYYLWRPRDLENGTIEEILKGIQREQ